MNMSLSEVLELRSAEVLAAAIVAFEATTNIKLTRDQKKFVRERAQQAPSRWVEDTHVVQPEEGPLP